MVRDSAKESLVLMTDVGNETIIFQVQAILESYHKAIRDCALDVILKIASIERAVEVVGELLAHQRTDLRVWAVDSLSDLAFKPQQGPNENNGAMTPGTSDVVHASNGSQSDGTNQGAAPALQPWPPLTEEKKVEQDVQVEAQLSPVSELVREGRVCCPGSKNRPLASVATRDPPPLECFCMSGDPA